MAFNGIYITDLGKNLLAKALTGKTLNFTKVKLGDGALTTQDISAMTNLINVVKTLDITKLKVNNNNGEATIETYFSNQTVTTGFYLREIGVYATDPDIGEILYMYGNAGSSAEYIPAYSSSTIIERNMSIIASINNATTISATLASNIYAKSTDLIGANIVISDAGNYYAGANTEVILQEVGAKMEQKADKYTKLNAVDINTIHIPNTYGVNNCTNVPYSTGYLIVLGFDKDNKWGSQILITDQNPSKMYFRASTSGTADTWTPWSNLSTTDKIDNLFESGTWTPTINFGTTDGTTAYQIQRASYKRVEKFIYCQFTIRFTNTGGTGDVRISSLPITPKNLGNVGVINNIAKHATNTGIATLSNTQTLSAFSIYKNTGVPLQGSEINDGSEITLGGSLQYEIA